MDLSEYANKCEIRDPAFEAFWKSSIKAYNKAGVKYGNKEQALKKWIEFGFDHLAGKELARRLNNKCEDRLSELRDTGKSQFLVHIPTWLNQKEWAEPEDRYTKFVAPEYARKLATDRPMPKMVESVEHKQYSPEERAKMQAGFKSQIKGVRKHV